MKTRKRQQVLHFILPIILELFIGRFAFAQTYIVGVPVCDTISTVTSYAHEADCGPFDDLTFRLDSTLVPYVTGLSFQVQITAVNGRIWSNLSDTIKGGDVFPLPAPVASRRLIIFLAPWSSFQFITRVVGTPAVGYENYYCEIKDALTLAVCHNYLDYSGTGQKCQVQPKTSVIRVPEDQPTIRSAIQVASSGDTVLVSSGVYHENIDFMGKDIVVGSLFLTTGDKDYIFTTIIEADSGSVVTFASRETQNALLCGFTITGGTGTSIDSTRKDFVYGAGILIRGASPVIKNNLITRNATWPACFGRGGGIAIMDSATPRIMSNTIIKNDVFGPCTHLSYFGGGIWVDATSYPIIGGSRDEANDIYSNQAGYGTELYREGVGKVINAQLNYLGSCPPGFFEVWPKNQFDVSNCLDSPTTIVGDNNNRSPATVFQLFQNYPNPFNASTTIAFDLSRPSEVSLKVFNMNGEEIATLLNQKKLAEGNHKINWNAQNLPSGIYIYRLQASGGTIATRKFVLLK